MSFNESAGNLLAGANTGPIQLRANKSDWSNYDETDDYSRTSALTFEDAPTVTVYLQGELIWGVEPGAAVCGNGTVEFTEECDDGNLIGGDGCSAICVQEVEAGVSGCTCPNGCDSLVNASVPLEVNGADNTCYFLSSSAGNYINSWNAAEVNLNGNDITNQWFGQANYPPQVDGGYYLYFKGDVPWAHVEVKY